MKHLHVGKFYYPQVGGIETITKTLAEGLVRAGEEVTVLCCSGDRKRHEFTHEGVRVVAVPNYGVVASQPVAPLLPPELKKLAREIDVVTVHSPHPLAELACMQFAKSKPWVVVYHSDVVRQRVVLPIYRPLIENFLAHAKAIVCSSDSMIERSPELPRFRGICHSIPHGIDLRPFEITPEREALAHKLKERLGTFALFVGRLVSYKGVKFLIDAAAQSSTRLVIVGDGPLKGALENQVQRLALGTQIHFAGEAPQSELAAYYSACQYLVLPSISKAEAYGLVMGEAMAFGKPVISTRLPTGVSEVNLDGVTGLTVTPSDSEALARAMMLISSDDMLRQRLSEGAKRHAEKDLSVERMIASYLEIYRSLSKN